MGWIYWGLYKKYYFYKTLAFLHVKVHAQRWVIQSGLCYHNQALVRNLISDIKKQIQLNSFLSTINATIWWLAVLKRIEKIIRGNGFDQKKEKTPGLQTTGKENKCTDVVPNFYFRLVYPQKKR